MHFDGLSIVTGFFLGWLAGCSVFVFTGMLRMNRDEPAPTPWEMSAYDPDVEVRWCDGQVETRLRHTKV